MTTTFHTVTVDGLNIFYREAGSRQNPTLLLLHGFPTSSHMFRNLMAKLGDLFHDGRRWGRSLITSIDSSQYGNSNSLPNFTNH